MKNLLKQSGFIVLFTISSMFIFSCSELDDDSQGSVLPSSFITPSGGILTAFDGNVTITFPEGTVSGTEEFHINTCLDRRNVIFCSGQSVLTR